MTTAPGAVVRRVRADEWREVRDLRREAVRDPAAPIAFLEDAAAVEAHDEQFWIDRTVRAAESDQGAQFVAEADGRWVGSLTVLLRVEGTPDHLGRRVFAARADIVGVYVAPDHRGTGVIDDLFRAGIAWAQDQGASLIQLDVHADNDRAQTAYRRVGFVDTGERLRTQIGDEMQMRWDGGALPPRHPRVDA